MAEHARDVVPKLDAEQLYLTSDLLESAQLAVDLAAMGERAAPPPPPAPPASPLTRSPVAPERPPRTARRPV